MFVGVVWCKQSGQSKSIEEKRRETSDDMLAEEKLSERSHPPARAGKCNVPCEACGAMSKYTWKDRKRGSSVLLRCVCFCVSLFVLFPALLFGICLFLVARF